MGVNFTLSCDRCGVTDVYGFKVVGEVSSTTLVAIKEPVEGHFHYLTSVNYIPFGDKKWLLCNDCGQEFGEQYSREVTLREQRREVNPEVERRWLEWFAKGKKSSR